MELNEIVIEGLRGFPQMTRVPLSVGLTTWPAADDRAGILVDVLLDLLYPKGTEPTLQHLVDPQAAQSRTGLLLSARDGTTFRILKDVRTGQTSLLKQSQGGFTPVTNRAPEISQAVTAQIGFPQEDMLRELFVTRLSDLPSQRPDAAEMGTGEVQIPAPGTSGSFGAAPPAPGTSGAFGAATEEKPSWNKPLPPGFDDAAAGVSDDFSHLDEAGRAAKLQELRVRRASVDKVKELEFEVDGLQKKAFALDERLRPVDSVERDIGQASQAMEQLKWAAELPPDILEVRARHDKITADHKTALAEIDEQRERLQRQLDQELARSEGRAGLLKAAFKDPFIQFGTLGGVVALIVGAVGFTGFEALRWVAMLDIIGFGAVVFGAFRFIDDLEVAARLKGQLAVIDNDRSRHVSRYEIDTSAFRALMSRHKLDPENLEDVEEAVRRYREAAHQKQAAEATLAEALGGSDLGALQAEREALSQRIKALEEDLYASGGFVGSPAELDAQITALEQLVEGKVPEQAPVPAAAEPPPIPPTTSSPGLPAAGPVETVAAMRRLLSHAADLFVVDLDTAAGRLQARASQYVAGMSDGRFSQLSFGPKGAVSLVDAASGRPIPFGMLPSGDRDVAYLCLKMTIIEAVVAHGRLPVILDRTFEPFPAVKHPLLVRMLQFVAQKTQVLVMTRMPSIAAVGGEAVALPPLVR